MALIAAALVRGVSSPASGAGVNNLPGDLPGRLGERTLHNRITAGYRPPHVPASSSNAACAVVT